MTRQDPFPAEIEKALGALNMQLCLANATIMALRQENTELRRRVEASRSAAPELSAAQQMLSER